MVNEEVVEKRPWFFCRQMKFKLTSKSHKLFTFASIASFKSCHVIHSNKCSNYQSANSTQFLIGSIDLVKFFWTFCPVDVHFREFSANRKNIFLIREAFASFFKECRIRSRKLLHIDHGVVRTIGRVHVHIIIKMFMVVKIIMWSRFHYSYFFKSSRR